MVLIPNIFHTAKNGMCGSSFSDRSPLNRGHWFFFFVIFLFFFEWSSASESPRTHKSRRRNDVCLFMPLNWIEVASWLVRRLFLSGDGPSKNSQQLAGKPSLFNTLLLRAHFFLFFICIIKRCRCLLFLSARARTSSSKWWNDHHRAVYNSVLLQVRLKIQSKVDTQNTQILQTHMLRSPKLIDENECGCEQNAEVALQLRNLNEVSVLFVFVLC